jgi:hypothetical protein
LVIAERFVIFGERSGSATAAIPERSGSDFVIGDPFLVHFGFPGIAVSANSTM